MLPLGQHDQMVEMVEPRTLILRPASLTVVRQAVAIAKRGQLAVTEELSFAEARTVYLEILMLALTIALPNLLLFSSATTIQARTQKTSCLDVWHEAAALQMVNSPTGAAQIESFDRAQRSALSAYER